jgi:hypothetical protein
MCAIPRYENQHRDSLRIMDDGTEFLSIMKHRVQRFIQRREKPFSEAFLKFSTLLHHKTQRRDSLCTMKTGKEILIAS